MLLRRLRGVSRIAEMSRITFWVNIYGFPKFNFSKNQFLSELDFHGVPPTNGIFYLLLNLKFMSPTQIFVTKRMFPSFSGRDSSQVYMSCRMTHTVGVMTFEKFKSYTRTLSSFVVKVSLCVLLKKTFALYLEPVTKWDFKKFKSSLSEHESG